MKKDKSKSLSMRQLADKCGVTLRAIQIAEKNGRIKAYKTTPYGKRIRKHFLESDVKKFNESRDPTALKKPTREQMGKGPQPKYSNPTDKENDKPIQDKEIETDDSLDPESFQKARTKREQFNAKITELDYKQKIGELVKTDEIKDKLREVSSDVCRQLLGVADRLAPVLVSITDIREAKTTIKNELTSVLKTISDGKIIK